MVHFQQYGHQDDDSLFITAGWNIICVAVVAGLSLSRAPICQLGMRLRSAALRLCAGSLLAIAVSTAYVWCPRGIRLHMLPHRCLELGGTGNRARRLEVPWI